MCDPDLSPDDVTPPVDRTSHGFYYPVFWLFGGVCMLDDLEQYLDKDKAERGQELAYGFAEEFDDWVRATYEEGETDEWDIDDIIDGGSSLGLTLDLPDWIWEAWYDSKAWERAVRADIAYAPSWYLMKRPRNFSGWLVHLTDHPEKVARAGFQLGVADPARLGLTRRLEDYQEKKGFNFAYDASEWMKYAKKSDGSYRYGGGAVVFRARGIKVWHEGDKEDQVIFWGPSARPGDMIPVVKREDGWMAEGRVYPSLEAAVESVTKSKPSPSRVAAEVLHKGDRPKGTFYGDDSGVWRYTEGYPLGLRREGWTWSASIGLSSRNDWRNLSVDGASEDHRGFRKALKEIVARYPEIIDYIISFDGPYKEVSSLVHGAASPTIGQDIDLGKKTYYHGTSDDVLDTILSEGLKPRGETNVDPVYGVEFGARPSRQEAVYLTTQMNLASSAAHSAARKRGGNAVILEIKGLVHDLFQPDEDSRETDAVKSLERMGSVAYVGRISPRNIRVYAMDDGKRWVKWGTGQFSVKDFLDKWYLMSREVQNLGYLNNIWDTHPEWRWKGKAYRVTMGDDPWVTPPTSWSKSLAQNRWYFEETSGYADKDDKGFLIEGRLTKALDFATMVEDISGYRADAVRKAGEVIALSKPSSVRTLYTVKGDSLRKVGRAPSPSRVASRWLKTGLSSYDLEDELDEAENEREVEKILDDYGFREVKLPNRDIVWVNGRENMIVEKYKGGWSPSELEDWIYGIDLDEMFPDEGDQFNKDFWSSPPPLYHNTQKSNVEDIAEEGLLPMNQTRGIGNRGTGAAVFTTSDADESAYGSYGPVTYKIDTKAMKRDGYKPYVSQETPVVEYEQFRRLADLLGVDAEPDLEHGMSPWTVVVFGKIPPQYLERID